MRTRIYTIFGKSQLGTNPLRAMRFRWAVLGRRGISIYVPAAMPSAPEGTVTFVFTDIVGSTVLWEKFPGKMGAAVARHDESLRRIFEAHEGFVFKTVGDAFCVAFATARDATLAAVNAQRVLAAENWGEIGSISVRMGVHSGTAEFRSGDYFGGTLNRVARIESAAHGGQILISQTTFELLQDEAPGDVQFKSLGDHRLRNLERPEHLYQVIAEGLTKDFPPPKSLELMPNNLPIQSTSFIGREVEMETIRRLLKENRLLTLLGTGGTGKTRLAIEVGSQVVTKFRDGVWLVELALLNEASSISEAVAAALGIHEEAERPLRESIVNFLRGKTLLLLLDNCEHLLEAVSPMVAEWLRSCPNVKILATSRHALGIAGETTFPVPPLGVFDIRLKDLEGPDIVERLTQYDAVKLFIARATAVRPSFVVTNANAPAVAEICSRLDGIPLAIELAAAHTRALAVEQIAARLGDRFRLLRGGNKAGLPHQKTLQALIDWSHDLLSEKEAIIFRRMGVFIGGRTVESLEAVCADEEIDPFEILELLEHLVDKSLVMVEEDALGQPRYTMIESVWQYAREKLDSSGEADAVRDRHLEYFLSLAEESAPQFEGPDQKEWMQRYRSDSWNFRGALEWAVKQDKIDEGFRLITALQRAVEVRGNPASIYALGEKLVAHPDAQKESLVLAKGLDAMGRMSWAVDRYDDARRYYEKAAAMLKKFGREVEAGYPRALIAFLDRGDGDLEASRKRFAEGLEFAREHNEERLIAICLSGLGSYELDHGNVEEARKMKEESLAIYRRVGDRWIIGLVLWGIAHAALAQGDLHRARLAIREWAEIVQDLGNRWLLAYVLESAAEIALGESQPERAARLFGGAEALREYFGAQFSVSEGREHAEAVAKLKSMLPEEKVQAGWQEGRVTPTSDFLKSL